MALHCVVEGKLLEVKDESSPEYARLLVGVREFSAPAGVSLKRDTLGAAKAGDTVRCECVVSARLSKAGNAYLNAYAVTCTVTAAAPALKSA